MNRYIIMLLLSMLSASLHAQRQVSVYLTPDGSAHMEGFLPAVNSAVGALIEADPSFGGWLDVLGSAKFYPVTRAEWNDVKQGVINVEQQALTGGNVKELLDALQAKIAG